jgi:cytochrome P450/NADPH-cytochrome P450 reductase
MAEPIPGPKAWPFVGNMLDLVDDEAPLKALEHLAEVYGPIYKLTRQGNRVIIVSSVEIMEEICDENRYVKAPPAGLANNKSDKPSGLFTAKNEDPDWGQAHRILMPAFGPLAIEAQFERESERRSEIGR